MKGLPFVVALVCLGLVLNVWARDSIKVNVEGAAEQRVWLDGCDAGTALTYTGRGPGRFSCVTLDGGSGGGGAPTDATYVVGSAHADLSAELVATDTATLDFDTGTAGQLKANVLSAPALSANPTDCGANQFATTIAANGNLTCAQVTTVQLSGTISDAQLANNYSGTGACAAGQFVSTLNDNAAPTCETPGGSPVTRGVLSADVTNSATAAATTVFTISPEANKTYVIKFNLGAYSDSGSAGGHALRPMVSNTNGTGNYMCRYMTSNTSLVSDFRALGVRGSWTVWTVNNVMPMECVATVSTTDTSDITLDILTETNGQTVRIKAGSWYEYATY